MKKIKYLVFVFIVIFALPIFFFGCEEVTFDSIAYTTSSKTAEELLNEVEFAKEFMIQNSKLKVKLKSTIIYDIKDYTNKESAVLKQEKVLTLGKYYENPTNSNKNIAILECSTYADNEFIKKETKTYLSNEEDNLVYVNSNDFIRQNTYYVDDFNSNTINSFLLFDNFVNNVDKSYFDSIYEKTFEDVKYYKLVSNSNGFNNLNDFFETVEGGMANFAGDLKLFTKATNEDYVTDFNCEYGLKAVGGSNYITYSTVDYSLSNNRRNWLNVSAKTTLENYGDSVVANEPSKELIAKCFVGTMNTDNSYIKYIVVGDNQTFSVLKNGNDYSVRVEKEGNNIDYYYLEYYNDNYVYYKLDTQNKTKTVDIDFDCLLTSFDFSAEFVGTKENGAFKFGSGEKEFLVSIDANNNIKLISKDNTEINIVDFGLDGSNLNLVIDISEYTDNKSGS